MTPNLLGFKVSGDYDELDELYDSVWSISMNDDSSDKRFGLGTPDLALMATRLLALCYDLRHAYQGSRNVELVPNGMDEEKAKWHGVEVPEQNVCYSVEILYPELMYEMMAINYFLDIRKTMIAKEQKLATVRNLGAQLEMDSVEGCLRRFQGKVLDALSAECSSGRFKKITADIGRSYSLIPNMYTQWLDILNADYASMSPKKRAQSFATIVRDLSYFNYHEQYLMVKHDIDTFIDEHPEVYDRSQVNLDIDWPEEFAW